MCGGKQHLQQHYTPLSVCDACGDKPPHPRLRKGLKGQRLSVLDKFKFSNMDGLLMHIFVRDENKLFSRQQHVAGCCYAAVVWEGGMIGIHRIERIDVAHNTTNPSTLSSVVKGGTITIVEGPKTPALHTFHLDSGFESPVIEVLPCNLIKALVDNDNLYWFFAHLGWCASRASRVEMYV